MKSGQMVNIVKRRKGMAKSGNNGVLSYVFSFKHSEKKAYQRKHVSENVSLYAFVAADEMKSYM